MIKGGGGGAAGAGGGAFRGSQVTEYDDDSYEEDLEPTLMDEDHMYPNPSGGAYHHRHSGLLGRHGSLSRTQSEYPRRGGSKGLFSFRPLKAPSRDRGSLPDGVTTASNVPTGGVGGGLPFDAGLQRFQGQPLPHPSLSPNSMPGGYYQTTPGRGLPLYPYYRYESAGLYLSPEDQWRSSLPQHRPYSPFIPPPSPVSRLSRRHLPSYHKRGGGAGIAPSPVVNYEAYLLHAPSLLKASFIKTLSGIGQAASIAVHRSHVFKISGSSQRRKEVLVDLDGIEVWLVLPPYENFLNRSVNPGNGTVVGGNAGVVGGSGGAILSSSFVPGNGGVTGATGTPGSLIMAAGGGGNDGSHLLLKAANANIGGGRTPTPSTATPRGTSERVSKGHSVQKHGVGGGTAHVRSSPRGVSSSSSSLSGSSSPSSTGTSPSLSRSSSGTYVNSSDDSSRSGGDRSDGDSSGCSTASDVFISEALFAELSSSVYPAVSMLPRLQILSTAYKVPGFLLDEDQRKDSKTRQTVAVGALACCSLRLQQHFTEVGAGVDLHSLSVMIGTPTPCEAFVDIASPALSRYIHPFISQHLDLSKTGGWNPPTTGSSPPPFSALGGHRSGQDDEPAGQGPAYLRSHSESGRPGNNWEPALNRDYHHRGGGGSPLPLPVSSPGFPGGVESTPGAFDPSVVWGNPVNNAGRLAIITNYQPQGNAPLPRGMEGGDPRVVHRPYHYYEGAGPLVPGGGQSTTPGVGGQELAVISRGGGGPMTGGAGRGYRKDNRIGGGVDEGDLYYRGRGTRRGGARGAFGMRVSQPLLRGLPMVLEGFSGAILLPNTHIRTDHLLSISPSSLSFTGRHGDTPGEASHHRC